jgi:hypothetical protein
VEKGGYSIAGGLFMEEGTKIINWKESYLPQNFVSSLLAIGAI